jgi:hypothetical protein
MHVSGDDEVNINAGLFNSFPKICPLLLIYGALVSISNRVWSIVDDQNVRV